MISLVAARAGTALWCTAIAFAPVSVGLVFDQRLVQWPQAEGKLGDRLKAFLMQHPVAREMVAEAQYDQNDVHWRKNLAYYSTTFAGDGFVLAVMPLPSWIHFIIPVWIGSRLLPPVRRS